MSEFTASNGVTIHEQATGTDRGQGVIVDGYFLPPIYVHALREFFQKENDDCLGRWRDPEQPEHLVYELFASTISVWSERYGTVRIYHREDPSETGSYLDRSAIGYFSTHAESKPAWHDAKPGEVWVVKFRTGPTFDESALVVPGRRWRRDVRQ